MEGAWPGAGRNEPIGWPGAKRWVPETVQKGYGHRIGVEWGREERGRSQNPSRITCCQFSCFPTSTQYFLFEFHETRLHLQNLLLEITVRGLG